MRGWFASGSVLIFGSAAGFGLNPMLGQLLLAQGFSPEVIALYRFLLPLLFVAVYLRQAFQRPSEAIRTFCVGLFAGVGMLGYFVSFTRLPSSTAILLYYSYPVFSVLIGSLFFGYRPTRNSWASAVLIIIAVSLAVNPEQPGSYRFTDLLVALLAPISFALLLNYFAHPRRPMPPHQRMACSLSGTLAILLPMTLNLEPDAMFLPQTLHQAVLVISIGIFSAALPQYLFALGAPRAGAEKTTHIGALELVFAMIFGVIFLGGPLTQSDATAALLIIVALSIRQEQDFSATRALRAST